jgi:hypothetical protein
MHYKSWLLCFLLPSTMYGMIPSMALKAVAKAAQMSLDKGKNLPPAAQQLLQKIEKVSSCASEVSRALGNPLLTVLDMFLDANCPLFKEFCELHSAGNLSALKDKLAQLKEIVNDPLNQSRPMLYEKKQIATLEFLLKQKAVTDPLTMAARFIIPWQCHLIYKIAVYSYEKLFTQAASKVEEVNDQKNTCDQTQSPFMHVDDPLYYQYVALQMSGQKKQLEEILSNQRQAIKTNPFSPMQYQKCQVATLEKLLQQSITDSLNTIANSELTTAEYAYQALKKQCENGKCIPEELEAAEMVLKARIDYKDLKPKQEQKVNPSKSGWPTIPTAETKPKTKTKSKSSLEIPVYRDLAEVMRPSGVNITKRFDDRRAAIGEVCSGVVHYSHQNYRVSGAATRLIQETGSNVSNYQSCYGNQVQHVVHQECIDIADQVADLPTSSPLHEHKESFVHCTDMAVKLNRVGAINYATKITDFCWSVINYTKALAQGTIQSVIEKIRTTKNLDFNLPFLSVLKAKKNIDLIREALDSQYTEISFDYNDRCTIILDNKVLSFEKAQIDKIKPYLPEVIQEAIKLDDWLMVAAYLNRKNITPDFIDQMPGDAISQDFFNALVKFHNENIQKTVSNQDTSLKPIDDTSKPKVHKPVSFPIETPNQIAARVRNYHNMHSPSSSIIKIDRKMNAEQLKFSALAQYGMKQELEAEIQALEKAHLHKLATTFGRKLLNSEIVSTLDAIAHGDLEVAIKTVEKIGNSKPYKSLYQDYSEIPLNEHMKAHIQNEAEDYANKFFEKNDFWFDEYQAALTALHNRKDYQQVMHFIDHPEDLVSAREYLNDHPQERSLIFKHLLQLPDDRLSHLASIIQEQQKSYDLIKERNSPHFQKEVRTNFGSQAISHFTEKEIPLYQDLIPLYKKYGYETAVQRYEKRIQAFQDTCKPGQLVQYETQSYQLSPQATELLAQRNNVTLYTSCYGSPLQQKVHQECIAMVEKLATLPENSPLYPHKDIFLMLTNVSCEYNQTGLTNKAAIITELLWMYFDYGKAILEGTGNAIINSVTDIIQNPFYPLLFVAAGGEGILAYQLGKVAYNLVGIGITYTVDPKLGKDLWHQYTAPITQLIDSLRKHRPQPRDIIKGATQCAVQWTIDAKLCECLDELFTTAKTNALNYAKKFPSASPQQYLSTPEGALIQSTHAMDHPDVIKNNLLQTMGKDSQKVKQGIKNVEQKIVQEQKSIEWFDYPKHKPPLRKTWQEIIAMTKHGHAKYKPGINIRELELHAWQYGTPVTTPGKNYKVYKFDKIIGANSGKETCYIRIECNANTIHGHPILESDYLWYLK